MKKKVALLGGTFDPIHFGHINLAKEIYKTGQVDEVMFSPANISPYKMNKPPIAKAKDRLKMIEITINGIDYFSCSDIELRREPPSYTIDTIKKLKNENLDLRLIITVDQLESFDNWKDYKEIIEIAPPIIGYRYSESKDLNMDKFNFSESNFIHNKILEVSSSEIRSLLKNRVCCNELVPKEVLDYIYEHKLYY